MSGKTPIPKPKECVLEITITYSNRATVNTGNYENFNPLYSGSMKLEVSDGVSLNDIYTKNYKLIKENVDKLLNEEIKEIRNSLLLKDPLECGHRITDGLPHVTNIISPDGMGNIPDLDKHCAVGNYLDLVGKHLVTDGLVALPAEIEDETDKWILDNFQDCFINFKKMWEKYKDVITLDEADIFIKNNKQKYCGTIDAIGTFDGEPAIFDFKKTKTLDDATLTKYFKQISAYAHAYPKSSRPTCAVILSPFNPPQVRYELGAYYELFKLDRKKYQEVYGV